VDADKKDTSAGMTFTIDQEAIGLPEYCVEL
jgi:hypothetical protein